METSSTKLKNSVITLRAIQRAIPHRATSKKLLTVIYYPYLIELGLIKLALKIAPSFGKKWAHRFLKRFLRYFFNTRGIAFTVDLDLPKTPPSTPFILWTARKNEWTSLVLMQQCPFPILTPVLPHIFEQLSLHPFKKWGKLKPLLETCCYPDNDTPENKTLLHSLIKEGYPIIAFVNKGYFDPSQTAVLRLYPQVPLWLKLTEYSWFVTLFKQEKTGSSSMDTFAFIEPDLQPWSSVFEQLPNAQDATKFTRLAAFFECNAYDI